MSSPRHLAVRVAFVLAFLVLVGNLVVRAPVEDRAPRGVLDLTSTSPLQIGISYGNVLPDMSPEALAAALDDAVGVGAQWVRLDLSWNDVQPDSPDRYNWSFLDRVVEATKGRRLNLLPVLAYTPTWARPTGCSTDKCAPSDPAQFATFAKAAVERYAPQGIHSWEIWNEPNLHGFWRPTPDAAAYVRLLSEATAAIKTADPSAVVMSGGLASTDMGAQLLVPREPDSRDISDLEFLDQMCAAGASHIVDAIAYHPYTFPLLPSFRASQSEGTSWNRIDYTAVSIRSLLTRYDSSSLPIVITEYGAPTGGPGKASDGTAASFGPDTDHVTESRQAAIAADAVRTAAATPTIRALIWYSQRDLGDDRTTTENFFGLRRADGTPKPALSSFRSAAQELHRR
jgi:hypothetical protein